MDDAALLVATLVAAALLSWLLLRCGAAASAPRATQQYFERILREQEAFSGEGKYSPRLCEVPCALGRAVLCCAGLRRRIILFCPPNSEQF